MNISSRVPQSRVRVLREGGLRTDRAYVLYWMIASRRLHANFALERACELARGLGLPLLVFEPLRVAYPHACDRFHRRKCTRISWKWKTEVLAGVERVVVGACGESCSLGEYCSLVRLAVETG